MIFFAAIALFSVNGNAWTTAGCPSGQCNYSFSWDNSTIANNTGPAWNGWQYVNTSSDYVLLMNFTLNYTAVLGPTANLTNITFINYGNADNTDIGNLSLWLDDGDNLWEGTGTDYFVSNSTWNAANSMWLMIDLNGSSVGVNISKTDINRLWFLTANLTANARYNRTINMTLNWTAGNHWVLGQAGAFWYNGSGCDGGPQDYNISAMNITRIDTTAPNVTINTPVNNTAQRGTITINATILDCGANNETVLFRLERPLGTAVTIWIKMYNTTLDDSLFSVSGGVCTHHFVQSYNTLGVADGSYWIRINATDFAQNENSTGNTSLISVDNVYCGDGTCAGTETCSSCPADCGSCGSGYHPPIIGPTVTQVTGTISSISAGTTGTILYGSAKTNIISIGIVPTETVKSVKVAAEKLDTAPSGVPTPSGTLKDYLEITASNINSDQINYVIIKFRVVKTWLTQNGFVSDDVLLQRYSNGVWTKLSTEMVEEDDEYYYFEAQSPGFSYFAITAEKAADCTITGCPTGFTCSLVSGEYKCIEETVCEGKTCPTGQVLNSVTCECETPPPCQGKTCPDAQTLNEATCECEEIAVADYTWYLVGIGIAIIIIVAVVLVVPKKK